MVTKRFTQWRAVWVLMGIIMAGGLRGELRAQETPMQVVDRAHQAHGGRWRSGAIADSVARGTIAILGDPRSPFAVTLTQKGRDKHHRRVESPGGDLRYGSDGRSLWQKSGPFTARASGRATHFLEGHTMRSLPRLFNYPTEGLALRDIGVQSGARVIEAQDGAGKRTRYHIDASTSLIMRLEFDTGSFYSKMFSGEPIPITAALVFSDYRDVGGIKTAFKIDFYLGFIKIEQMTLTAVQYNVGIPDTEFTP